MLPSPEKLFIFVLCLYPPQDQSLCLVSNTLHNQHGKEVDSSMRMEHHSGYITYIHIWKKHMSAGKGCIPPGLATARCPSRGAHRGLPAASSSASGSVCHSLQPPRARGCHPSLPGVLGASMLRCGREPQGGNATASSSAPLIYGLTNGSSFMPEFCKALFDFAEGST